MVNITVPLTVGVFKKHTYSKKFKCIYLVAIKNNYFPENSEFQYT